MKFDVSAPVLGASCPELAWIASLTLRNPLQWGGQAVNRHNTEGVTRDVYKAPTNEGPRLDVRASVHRENP